MLELYPFVMIIPTFLGYLFIKGREPLLPILNAATPPSLSFYPAEYSFFLFSYRIMGFFFSFLFFSYFPFYNSDEENVKYIACDRSKWA